MLALGIAALVCVGSSAAHADAPIVQELPINGSGGVQLACGLILPAGSVPAGGWPGVLLFPGLGQTHAAMETIATDDFAPAGLASLTCDERGIGASQGTFDIAGPDDVADVQALFSWFAGRGDVSDTAIGAYGESVGGAEVWNAAVAGVPFKAIVPVATWSNLRRALLPKNEVKTRLLDSIGALNPISGWRTSTAIRARSARSKLATLAVPTLIVQNRYDLFFDIYQGETAYALLAGPKRLYIGKPTQALGGVSAWFAHYLGHGPPLGRGVEFVGPRGNTEVTRNFPETRSLSVNLPGTTTLKPATLASRSVWLPAGPFETLGDGHVTVRYSGGQFWNHLVATVSLPGSDVPVTEGTARLDGAAGVVKIPLMDEAVFLPRGKRLVVTIGAGSPDQLFSNPVPPTASLTVTRVTLTLSVLDH